MDGEPIPRSAAWSVPDFVSTARTAGWIDGLPIADLLMIIGGYFCNSYQFRRPPAESLNIVDQTGRRLMMNDESIQTRPIRRRISAAQTIGSNELPPYFAVRIRPSVASKWSIHVGLSPLVSDFVDCYTSGVLGFSAPNGYDWRTNLINVYLTSDIRLISTAGRITARQSKSVFSLIQADAAVVIGCVADLETNTARFYLDDEPFIDSNGNPAASPACLDVSGIRRCFPFVAASGVQICFELLPDWLPPANCLPTAAAGAK